METDPGSRLLITNSAIEWAFQYCDGSLSESSGWPLLCYLTRTHCNKECKVRAKTTDITLISEEDGSEIVHRVVLSASSPFLSAQV